MYRASSLILAQHLQLELELRLPQAREQAVQCARKTLTTKIKLLKHENRVPGGELVEDAVDLIDSVRPNTLHERCVALVCRELDVATPKFLLQRDEFLITIPKPSHEGLAVMLAITCDQESVRGSLIKPARVIV